MAVSALRHRMNSSRFKKVRMGIVIAVCAALFFVPAVRERISQGVFFVLRPVLLRGVGMKDSIRSFSEYADSFRNILSANEELRAENQKLKELVIDYDLLKSEREESGSVLSFVRSKPFGVIGARVIGSFVDPSGTTIIINGGRADGISGGAFVLAGERTLVGRISALTDTAARISILRNNGTTLGIQIMPGKLSSSTTTAARVPVEGLFIGKGNDAIIDLVPNTADVRIGDIVVTNGFGEGGIRDLIIGEVASVQKRDATIFQEIHVRESYSLNELSVLFTVTGRGEGGSSSK